MGTLDLWLIRHGETTWNREDRTQGHSHNPLSDLGIRQAQRLGVRLETEHFEHIYSSDLKRALQTAELAFLNKDIIHKRLREIGRGVLEGTTAAERTQEQRDLLLHVKGERLTRRPPGGENFQYARLRLESWLGDLPKRGKVAAITHGGVISAALQCLVGYDKCFSFAVNNTRITRLILEEGHTTISFVNDHTHIRGQENLWTY